MTEQDFQHEPARVEISPPNRYARAGAHDDRDPARDDPARARFLAGQGDGPAPAPGPGPGVVAAPAATARASRASSAGQPRRPNGRFAHYPLRRRAARIRVLGHADHRAAPTPRDELAAAVDYARRAAAVADRAGMRDAESTAALRAAIDAVMAVGDTLTAAMHTWRPAP